VVTCSGALEITVEIGLNPYNNLVGTPMYGVGYTGLVPFTCTFQSYCSAGTYNFVAQSYSSGNCWQDYVNVVATGVGGVTVLPSSTVVACF
jgi:hypothetical protein